MADLNDRTKNVNLWDDAKQKAVTLTTDGIAERLDVSSKLVGISPVSFPRYAPRTFYSNTEIILGLNTILASLTFDGKIDAVKIVFSKDKDLEIVLESDGFEFFRIHNKDIDKELKLDEEESHFPLGVDHDGKNFFIQWNVPVDIKTQFIVKGNVLNGNPKMKAIYIQYRELI